MDCDDVIRSLPDMLYDEIDDRSRSMVNEHLAHCASCRDEYELFRRTVRVLDQWSPAEAPGDTKELAQLLEGSVRNHRNWIVRRPILSGLAAGMILFVGLMLLNVNVAVGNGRLTISVGRAIPDVVPEKQNDSRPSDQQLYQFVNDRVEHSATLAGEALVDFLHDWTEAQERRQLAILSLIGQQREHDLAAVDERLRALEQNDLVYRQQAQFLQSPTQRSQPGWPRGRFAFGNTVYQTVYNEQTGQFEFQPIADLNNQEVDQ